MKNILLILLLVFKFQTSFAQTETKESAAPANQFEVIDISGQISGELLLGADKARKSWTTACADWKKETKDLNKNNEVLGINCNSPTCTLVDAARTQCTSTGTYQVKTAGVRVKPLPEPPVSAQLPPEHEISTPPPEVVVEAVPPVREGFIWIPGYWGWGGRRHMWYPGHWVHERKGYLWIGGEWERHGAGWHFSEGHWEIRH
ncbi:MAG: YXWGXW repeat-containing protein [Pseudobdellovibrio sp.]